MVVNPKLLITEQTYQSIMKKKQLKQLKDRNILFSDKVSEQLL